MSGCFRNCRPDNPEYAALLSDNVYIIRRVYRLKLFEFDKIWLVRGIKDKIFLLNVLEQNRIFDIKREY